MQRLLFYILFFSWPGSVSAQPPQHYIFSHLGSNSGLISDDVRAVQQDRKGFIWIATVNGLQRYDGQRFLTFRHSASNPKSIPSDKIWNILTDHKDRLWLHCGANSLGYFNTNDFSFHEVPVRPESNFLKTKEATLFIDNKGNVILLMSGHFLVTYNETADEFSEKHNLFTIPSNWGPKWLYQDHQNNYWMGCDSGLVKYNPATKKISYKGHNEEKDEIITAFADINYISHPYLDRSGRFWIERWTAEGSGPYILSYDVNTNRRTDWDSLHYLVRGMYHEVRSIFEQDDGSIWITGLNIMVVLSPSAKKFESIYSNLPGEYSIRFDVIHKLVQDREKNIWTCTDRGLYRFNPSARLFSIFSNRRPGKDSAFTPDVTDILQTSDGDILVSTWGNGTFSYDNNFMPKDLVYTRPTLQSGQGLTWALHERKNGDIWRVCQGGFIFITSPKTKITIRIQPAVFQEATIRQILEDKNGNLWFGSHRGHLVKWTAATNTFQLIHKSSTVYRLYKDKKEDIWVCTGGDGVYRINPDNNTITARYTNNEPKGKKLMGMGAADIVQYNDSIYAVASEALNLLNIKTGAIKFFSTANGLPSDAVTNLIMDKRGFLWLTTENRLCRLDINGFVLSTFHEEDGLPSGSFNEATANLLNDGRIAFGRVHDFIVFDPELIRPENIPIPQAEITGFALMNSWLSVDSLQKLKEVRLRYNQNAVTIEFSTLTYLNGFGVSYMMKGLDKNWIPAGGAKEAVYNYLPPGNYTFMIRCESGTDNTPVITTLKIAVNAPFWETWWFYSLLAILVAFIFYLIDKERIRRKEGIQKMRGEIAGNLHQEINTALNNINVLSEIARIKADKEPEQSKSYINEIHHKSHHMIIAMDDMLWSIDPANDNMGKTINRIKEFADALHNRYNSSIDIQTSEKVTTLKLDMKVRHELILIYKIALRLLVEDAGAKQTMIHLYYIQSQLQLNIFSPEVRLNDCNNPVIKAIVEMKTRAASIKASLEFQSDEKGTAIILAVKTA